jgi:predicted NUDIX family NTP pyrophosphohydrolase
MSKISAGIILYRKRKMGLEVLLVHPGGPFWAKKDLGAWSMPKGEIESGENLLFAAKREFEEELGFAPPPGEFIPLASIVQRSGKIVHAWAVEGDYNVRSVKSNMVRVERPPGSGKFWEFPEIDRAEFFGVQEARKKINPAQIELLERLEAKMANQ